MRLPDLDISGHRKDGGEHINLRKLSRVINYVNAYRDEL